MKREVALTILRVAMLASLGSAAAWLLIGPPAMVFVVIVAALWLVWRFDNWTGSCLMLAVLLLLVMGILTFLVGMVALPR